MIVSDNRLWRLYYKCALPQPQPMLQPQLASSITIVSDGTIWSVIYDRHYDDRNSFIIQATWSLFCLSEHPLKHSSTYKNQGIGCIFTTLHKSDVFKTFCVKFLLLGNCRLQNVYKKNYIYYYLQKSKRKQILLF